MFQESKRKISCFYTGIIFICWLVGLLGIDQSAYSQNLLANGSFEEENICTEYSQNCAPEAWISNSLRSDYYVYEPPYAYDGTHFIGLIVGNERRDGVRSFVRSRLLCGLRKGSRYRLEFYTRSWHNASDSLGIYFSPTDFLFEAKPYQSITPSIWLRDTLVHHTATNTYWARHTLTYTATGNEVFFTIGSFKRKESYFSKPPDRQLNYYVYIDDVSLVPEDEKEKLCSCADSVKRVLYSENERHDLLDRKMYANKKNPPLVPVPPLTVIQKIDTLIIPDVLFANASATLNQQSFAPLDSFSLSLTGKRIDSLVFEGHTDSVGTLTYNQQLSTERARAVAGYVEQKANIPGSKVTIRSYAYLRPRAPNTTPQGRQKNRRVEVYLYMHE
ncbi:MAG: OmpA family protein [Williamsia sp.]|nr:OmpA family protein [Williamsia sp.]